DDVLAALDRRQHQLARDAGSADQLDDDVDLGIVEDAARVVDDVDALAHPLAGAGDIEVGDLNDLDRAAGTAPDLVLGAAQHVEGAAAHRADAEQPVAHRAQPLGGRRLPRGSHAFLSGCRAHAAIRMRPSLRNISLMPRTAWRMRCSFSISAKRTWSSPYSPKPMPGETATFASTS